MRRPFLPVSGLAGGPYGEALAYPRPTARQKKSRVAELQGLGVSSVAAWGPVRVGAMDVLGKGYVGLVLLGRRRGRAVAVKLRRSDSQRSGMAGEARMLAAANRAGVGPRLAGYSRNVLVMEYLDGQRIGEWAASAGPAKMRAGLRKILEDCYRLDAAGIDHGELSSMPKHAIMGRHTTLVDFESASAKRRASNVTSAGQGLFIGSGVAKCAAASLKLPPKSRIISALRQYKAEPGPQSFGALLGVLEL